MPKLGQHFLRSDAILTRIARAIEATDGAPIVEIGPGHGELTRHIAQIYPNSPLILIERDHDFIAPLHENFPAASIIEGDAGDRLSSTIPALHNPWFLVGNIPYYITGDLMRTLFHIQHRPHRSVFLIQKEVAERITATPPHMNRLAASVQYWAKSTTLFSVPRTAFSPPPKVVSAVIQIGRAPETPAISPNHYDTAIRTLFAQPRKTIFNNLRDVIPQYQATQILETLSLPPTLRPQNLTVNNISDIARLLPNKSARE